MTNAQISETQIETLTTYTQAALVWLESCRLEWVSAAEAPYDEAILRLLRLLTTNGMSAIALASNGLEQAPSALVLGRPCLEIGLTVKWMLSAPDAQEVLRRWLGCHLEAADWMEKVAKRSADVGFQDQADRWTSGATRRNALIAKVTSSLTLDGPIKRPDVASLCRTEGLSRLYYGYQLSSQFVHGGILASEEFYAPMKDEPVERPIAADWLLPLSMIIWGVLFSSKAYTEHFADKVEVDPLPLERVTTFFNSISGFHEARAT
ncbi:DUF5677 domain-containing protein [Kribbella sp. NPDC023855]|uniref:DUF5677 domain-containing protein n=1 Tax=Kribbella sp. NPDC023855 TaxID=3154698 RepID=UPI0033CB664A